MEDKSLKIYLKLFLSEVQKIYEENIKNFAVRARET